MGSKWWVTMINLQIDNNGSLVLLFSSANSIAIRSLYHHRRGFADSFKHDEIRQCVESLKPIRFSFCGGERGEWWTCVSCNRIKRCKSVLQKAWANVPQWWITEQCGTTGKVYQNARHGGHFWSNSSSCTTSENWFFPSFWTRISLVTSSGRIHEHDFCPPTLHIMKL